MTGRLHRPWRLALMGLRPSPARGASPMRRHRPWRLGLIGLLALCLAPAVPAPVPPVFADQALDPLLYFAGEDLSVTTVASRRPETPQRAPAVVRVITAQEILARGYRTLADLLRHEAGFVIRPGERGSTPYLRGIREGILFLYDGVPLHSNVTKSIHPLDEDLSLAAIDRVEIVLGPGSVLWGPDAYAGIVNVVPFKSVEVPGGQVRVWGGAENDRGAGMELGGRRGAVSGRIAVSGERFRYWEDSFATLHPPTGGAAGEPGASAGFDTLEDSAFWEAVGTLSVGDRLSFVGRLTDHRNRFTLTSSEGLTWPGEKRAPVSFLKGTGRQPLGASDLTLNVSYTNARLELTDADVARSQTDDIWAGELLWYRPMGQGGAITVGVGYRDDRTRDAVVRDGFLPDYLKPSYRVFVPRVVQADFDNTLTSAFAQVRRKFGPVDVWAGLRHDDPDAYGSFTTFNAGAAWTFWDRWRLKAALGTAYRNPYAAQLYAERSLEAENIRTASVELGWDGGPGRHVSVSLFHSALADHLQEDPYGGLSRPSDPTLYGGEIQGRWRLKPGLDLFGSAAAVGGDDHRVDYRVIKAFFVAPDGTVTPIEDAWSAPLDRGPEWTASVGVRWRPLDRWVVSAEGLWTAPWPYAYDRGQTTGTHDGERNLRASVLLRDAGPKGASLQLTADNVFNHRGSVPGVFGPAERPPLRVWLEWRWNF